MGLPRWLSSKKTPVQETQEMQVKSLGWEDPLEEEMATQYSILAWKNPWTEEHARLQSMWSQRVGHDWATEHAHALSEKKFKIFSTSTINIFQEKYQGKYYYNLS